MNSQSRLILFFLALFQVSESERIVRRPKKDTVPPTPGTTPRVVTKKKPSVVRRSATRPTK